MKNLGLGIVYLAVLGVLIYVIVVYHGAGSD